MTAEPVGFNGLVRRTEGSRFSMVAVDVLIPDRPRLGVN